MARFVYRSGFCGYPLVDGLGPILPVTRMVNVAEMSHAGRRMLGGERTFHADTSAELR